MKKKAKKILLGSVLSMSIIAIVLFLIWGRAFLNLNNLKKLAIEQGFIFTAKDAGKYKQSSYLDNKEEKAFSIIKSPSDGEDRWLPFSGRGPSVFLDAKVSMEQQTHILSYIKKNNQFFKIIESEDDSRPKQLSIYYLSPNYVKLFDEAMLVKISTMLFSEKVETLLQENNADGTVSALQYSLNLQNILLNKASFIYNYAYQASTNIWLHSFNRAINNLPLPDKSLRQLITAMQQRENDLAKSFSTMLYEETFNFFQLVNHHDPLEAGTIQFWNEIAEKKQLPNVSGKLELWLWFGGVFEKKAMLTNALAFQQLINYNNYPIIKADLEKLQKYQQMRWSAPFCSRYTDFNKNYLEYLNTVAYLRCAIVTTATILYYRENGKVPKEITELTPKYIDSKMLCDPYGKLLQMKYGSFNALLRINSTIDREFAERVGLRIFSVGYNGIDDGGNGISGSVRGGDYSDDITFIWVSQYKK